MSFRYISREERQRNRARRYAAKRPDGSWAVDVDEAVTLADLKLMQEVRGFHPEWISFVLSAREIRAADDD